MTSYEIITSIQHVTTRGLAVDDFFILRINHWEAAQLLGGLYVDEESMMNLLEWATTGVGYTALVSIDGKYGAVVHTSDIDKPKTDSKVLKLHDEFRSPITRVKTEFRKLLSINPNIGKHLNLQAFQKAIPDRISFLGVKDDFRPETIEREIDDARFNVESATDDALVWITIIGATAGHRLDIKSIEAVERELQMRLEKRSEFRSTFFPLDKVTQEEIAARSRRANRDLENCRQKFPVGQDYRDEELHRYARSLSNDRLAAMCAVLNYQDNWGHPPYKHLLMQLDDRISRALGRK
jgi:hypothetical protein